MKQIDVYNAQKKRWEKVTVVDDDHADDFIAYIRKMNAMNIYRIARKRNLAQHAAVGRRRKAKKNPLKRKTRLRPKGLRRGKQSGKKNNVIPKARSAIRNPKPPAISPQAKMRQRRIMRTEYAIRAEVKVKGTLRTYWLAHKGTMQLLSTDKKNRVRFASEMAAEARARDLLPMLPPSVEHVRITPL